MFFTKKFRKLLLKLNYLFGEQCKHNILVSDYIETVEERLAKLESRIKYLEKRNRDNENVIDHLINLTKKESFKDENQQELNLRQKL